MASPLPESTMKSNPPDIDTTVFFIVTSVCALVMMLV